MERTLKPLPSKSHYAIIAKLDAPAACRTRAAAGRRSPTVITTLQQRSGGGHRYIRADAQAASLSVTGIRLHRYLRLKRLSQVRCQLLTGSRSVKAVALANGFWHLGDFSRVYNEAFGELPSQTRARVEAVPFESQDKRPGSSEVNAW